MSVEEGELGQQYLHEWVGLVRVFMEVDRIGHAYL